MRPGPVLALVLWCVWLEPATAAPLALTFDLSGPVATGATASGEVAWVGVSRVPKTYFQEVSRVRETSAADAGGSASLRLDAPAPHRSVWVAVDVTSGAFVVGTPESFLLEEEALTGAHLSFDGSGNATGLRLEHAFAEVLLVRPGVGAWSLEAVDGAASDTDGEANRAVRLSLAALSSSAATPPPAALQAGDVVVVLDPNTLTYLAATIPASLLAQGGN